MSWPQLRQAAELVGVISAAQSEMSQVPREGLPDELLLKSWEAMRALCKANEAACAHLNKLTQEVLVDVTVKEDKWRKERFDAHCWEEKHLAGVSVTTCLHCGAVKQEPSGPYLTQPCSAPPMAIS